MNDNKLINLNFVDGMLEAVMHRFKKIDDTMKAELPAEAPAPNQQLVTDANGAAKWEDRTHYESGLIGFKISPENTRAEEDTTGDVWYIADDKDAGNITPEVRSAMRAITEDFVAHQSERQEYAAYWDGVRYTGRIFRLPGSVYFGDPHSLETPYMMVSSGGSGILIRVVSKDDAEHTFAYETFDYELKPLDESFLPATVPVIQSASVGQTVVVKAVDENGKPTEWEASNKLNELSEENATVKTLLDVQTIVIPPNLNATKYQSGAKNGVSYTVNADNSITLFGTPTADTWPIPDAISRAAAGFWLEAGTYTFSNNAMKNVAVIYLCTYADDTAVTLDEAYWPDWTTGVITFTTAKRLFAVATPCYYGKNNLDGITMKAKLEVGTVATEYVSPWVSGDEGVMVSARLDKIEESIGLGNVPNYYLTDGYLTNKVLRINEVGASVGGNGDVFMVVTDQHWESNAKKSPALMNYLSLNCRIPRLFALGDIAFGLNEEYLSMLDKAYCGTVHHVAGNHEWDHGTTGNALAYYMDSGKENQIGNAERHYYYVDNRQQKIRYIIMSSETEGNGNGYEAEQLAWLTDTALNVDAGWSIVVFAHSIYNYNPTNDAFGMVSHAQAFLSALDNYSGNGEIVAVFSGHTHRDAVLHTTGGIPIILTACDKYKPYMESGVDKEPWMSATRTEGTITEQAFDVVAVDKANRKLTLIRIGAPADNRVDNTSSGTVQERVVTY